MSRPAGTHPSRHVTMSPALGVRTEEFTHTAPGAIAAEMWLIFLLAGAAMIAAIALNPSAYQGRSQPCIYLNQMQHSQARPRFQWRPNTKRPGKTSIQDKDLS